MQVGADDYMTLLD